MPLRYKISLTLAAIIIAGIAPVAFYIVHVQESDRMESVRASGDFQARLFARSVLNILLMDAGDLNSSRVDAQELSSIYKALEGEGLLRAVAWLSSKETARDGRIVAGFDRAGNVLPDIMRPGLDSWEKSSFAAVQCGNHGEACLRFTADAGPPGKPPLLHVELLYSLAEVSAPIVQLRRILYATVAGVIVLMLVAGLVIARRITQPLQALMEAVQSLGTTGERKEIAVTTSDELGRLSQAFNSMAKTIDDSISELKKKNEELKELDRMKDDFLAVTSHELKTPLNGIIGLSGTLLQGATGPLSEALRNNIQVIRSSGIRLATLVDKILQVSELRNNKVTITPMPVNLAQVIGELQTLMAPAAAEKKLRLQVDLPTDLPAVMADRDRLTQILYNLVGNAIKFTEQGEVTVTARPHDGKIRISVRDTGIGIAPANHQKIFRSFEQLESSETRRYGGLGLGLSVSQQLAALHQTRIELTSMEGKGSEFWFDLNAATVQPAISLPEGETLPLHRLSESIAQEMQTRAATAPQKHEAASSERRTYNILLVDDEPVNLQVLINQLSLVGYKVNVAQSGKQAIDYMEHEPVPDAILLDVMMPGMSGYDVSRYLRNKYASYEVPILMLTAKNRSEEVIRGFEAGANDYITKPIESEVLLARVRTAISLKESVREKDLLENLQRELSVAQKVQQALLPVRYPSVPGLRIAARYQPMAEVGGDFYDFVENDNGLGVLIADVSGHGIPAALIASMVKMAFSLNRHLASEPARLLSALNQVLVDKVDNHFVTASYYFIDLRALWPGGHAQRSCAGNSELPRARCLILKHS
jgi:two-component system sensor histidine kinase ChiS